MFKRNHKYTATNYRNGATYVVTCVSNTLKGVTFKDDNNNTFTCKTISDSAMTYTLTARNDKLHVLVKTV